jgi:hypothetical protein
MRVAMLVGALMFGLLSGVYEIGLVDMGSPDSQSAVRAYDDCFPPPPSWP